MVPHRSSTSRRSVCYGGGGPEGASGAGSKPMLSWLDLAKMETAMPVREGPPQPAPPRNDPADKVRGGDIIARTRLQRAIFIAGLVGVVLLALLLQVAQ
jgi:hypothetical protein